MHTWITIVEARRVVAKRNTVSRKLAAARTVAALQKRSPRSGHSLAAGSTLLVRCPLLLDVARTCIGPRRVQLLFGARLVSSPILPYLLLTWLQIFLTLSWQQKPKP